MDAEGERRHDHQRDGRRRPGFKLLPRRDKAGLRSSLPSGAAIGAIGVDGSNETTIASAPPGGYYTAPRWSPDGQTIAFSGSTTLRGTSMSIRSASTALASSISTAVPDGEAQLRRPGLGTGLEPLVFTHNAAGQEGWVAPGVWVIDADGTDLHPILLSSGCPSTNSAGGPRIPSTAPYPTEPGMSSVELLSCSRWTRMARIACS